MTTSWYSNWLQNINVVRINNAAI